MLMFCAHLSTLQCHEMHFSGVMEFIPSMFIIHLCLLNTLAGDRSIILFVPPQLKMCGDGEVSIPACSYLNALKNCTNSLNQTSSFNFLVGKDHVTGEPLQLALVSRDLVSVLSEHAFRTSSGIARALGAITQHFKWNRLLIVSDISNPYFLHTAEEFYKIIQTSSSEINFVQPSSDEDVNNVVDLIDRENLRIIVLSVRPSIVQELLCIAQERKWVWPEYAWMVHSIDLDQFTACNSDQNGVIIHIQDQTPSANLMCSSTTCSAFSLSHDSLEEMLTLMVMDISVQIGVSNNYSLENGTISSINITGPLPSDLPPEYVAIGFIILYYFCIAVSFLIITINFALYIYFRNEPTVKATSVPLSTLIFIGCYLLLIYLADVTFVLLPSHYKRSKHFRDGVCVVAALFNFLGYPIILIFSTLLVKLLRVYWIFNRLGKLNKYACNDIALAGFALLISSPSAILLLVWVISNPYTDLSIFSFASGLLFVVHDCVSSYEVFWLLGNLGYLCCLAFCLTIFAFLTRKIKYKEFKDTKSLTSLSFVVVFTTSLVVSYWYIARQIGEYYLLLAIIHFGDYAIVLECQGFIFVLKLFPVIKSRIVKKLNKVRSVPVSKLTADPTTFASQ